MVWTEEEVGSDDVGEDYIHGNRGFSARHGMRKKLQRRRNPDAPCECRGRAAYARSRQSVNRCMSPVHNDRLSRIARRYAATQEGREVDEMLREEAQDYNEGLVELPQRAGRRPKVRQASPAPRPRSFVGLVKHNDGWGCSDPVPEQLGLLRQRSVPVTCEEVRDAEPRSRKACVSLQGWASLVGGAAGRCPLACRPHPGAAADGKALEEEEEEEAHDVTKEQAAAAPPPQQQRPTRGWRFDDALRRAARRAAEWRLATARAAVTSRERKAKKEREPIISFEAVRTAFRSAHEAKVREGLARAFEGPVALEPVGLGPEAQQKFLSNLRTVPSLLPVFHGTHESLMPSIRVKGLLVPGEGDVTVRNGSAYGVGIYTAGVQRAWLSKGYCSTSRMFVCGVLENVSWGDLTPRGQKKTRTTKRKGKKAAAAAPAAAAPLGPARRPTAPVERHGDAVVVFDSRLVVPLFEAVGQGFRSSEGPAAPQQK